jgi:threonine dehydrogenase-like Zn-dependent dehydrogenase
MKAVVFDKGISFPEDRPRPEPAEGEALIRVHMSGICNTDLELTRGYMGFCGILGHEFVGVVEGISGPDTGFVGKRVVGGINLACGKCRYCRRGMKTHCADRTVLGILGKDGSFAEYVTLPVENLMEVPGDVSDEEAVFTEPLAAALQIADQVHIRPSDRILVMGDGKLGILTSLALRQFSADVTLAGKHINKLDIAKAQGVGTVNIMDLKAAGDYDIVVEATGSRSGLGTALEHVRPRGTVVLKTTVAGPSEINLASIVINEINVVGSRCGPFEPALSALSRGLLDVRPLITAVFGFDRAEEAFAMAGERESLKVIIDFS